MYEDILYIHIGLGNISKYSQYHNIYFLLTQVPVKVIYRLRQKTTPIPAFFEELWGRPELSNQAAKTICGAECI